MVVSAVVASILPGCGDEGEPPPEALQGEGQAETPGQAPQTPGQPADHGGVPEAVQPLLLPEAVAVAYFQPARLDGGELRRDLRIRLSSRSGSLVGYDLDDVDIAAAAVLPWRFGKAVILRTSQDHPLAKLARTSEPDARLEHAGVEYLRFKVFTDTFLGEMASHEFVAKPAERTYVASEDDKTIQAAITHLAGGGEAKPDAALRRVLDEIGGMSYVAAGAEHEGVEDGTARGGARDWGAWFPAKARAAGMGVDCGPPVVCRGVAVFADEDAASAAEGETRARIDAAGLAETVTVTRDGTVLRVRRTMTDEEFRPLADLTKLPGVLDGARD